MEHLIETGGASSPWDAARAVCERAAGGGTWESKAKRLLHRYMERQRQRPKIYSPQLNTTEKTQRRTCD
jgi:hypothetical protein